MTLEKIGATIILIVAAWIIIGLYMSVFFVSPGVGFSNLTVFIPGMIVSSSLLLVGWAVYVLSAK